MNDSSDDEELFGGFEDNDVFPGAEDGDNAHDPNPEYVDTAEFKEFVEKNSVNLH